MRRMIFFCLLMVAVLQLAVAAPVLAQMFPGQVVKLSVAVPPKPDSFEINLSSDRSESLVSPGQTLSYTVSYRSKNEEAVPLTLQVSWKNMAESEGSTQEAELQYVIGSATNAEGLIKPVVDIEAQTITWSLPAVMMSDRPQSVGFQLIVPTQVDKPSQTLVTLSVNSIDGVRPVSKMVTIRPGASEPGSLVSSINPDILRFLAVTVKAVNETAAQIQVTTNNPAVGRLVYGLSPAELSQTALVMGDGTNQIFLLQNLEPNTPIYYQVMMENEYQAKASDIFVLTTAARPGRVQLEPWSLSLSYKNTILRQGVIEPLTNESVPLQIEGRKKLMVTMSLPDTESLSKVELFLRPVSVSNESGDQINSVPSSSVLELNGPTSLVGGLTLPTDPGDYQLVSSISDRQGNTAETPLLGMVITPPLRLIDDESGLPLRGGTGLLLKETALSGGFEPVKDLALADHNPQISNAEGIIEFNFSPGRYQLWVSVPGYQPARVEFEVDPENLSQIPSVRLVPIINPVIGRLLYQMSQLSFF